MPTSRSTLVASLAVTAILAAACSGDPVTDGEDEPEGGTSVAIEMPLTDETSTVSEVFAEIAAMDLSPEERHDYLYERALEEGEILFYSSMNVEINEAWAEGFRDAYPEIDQQYVGLGRPADLLERVRAEARAGRHLVDVVQGATVGTVLQDEGLVALHHGVTVPAGFPDEYVEDFGIMLTLSPQVIAWNTNLVSDRSAPREIDDFLDPEHAGCVFTGGPTWIATMIADRGFEATERWLQDFVANEGVVEVASTSGNTRSLAAGEFDCMVYSHTHTLEPMIVDDGAPIEWHAPDPTPAAAQRIYVYEQAPRPHAAALFVHWILSEDGVQVLADDSRIPLYPGVETSYERLRPFSVVGSELQQRLRPLTTEESLEVDEQALDLIESYAVPTPDSS